MAGEETDHDEDVGSQEVERVCEYSPHVGGSRSNMYVIEVGVGRQGSGAREGKTNSMGGESGSSDDSDLVYRSIWSREHRRDQGTLNERDKFMVG